MFRILSAFFVAGIMLAFVGAPVVAEEKAKEEKLEGKITCAKCDLGLEKACMTVIKVGDKVYYFDEATSKKHHKAICTAAKDGTVTGTVKKDGDKLIVTPSKVEFK